MLESAKYKKLDASVTGNNYALLNKWHKNLLEAKNYRSRKCGHGQDGFKTQPKNTWYKNRFEF